MSLQYQQIWKNDGPRFWEKPIYNNINDFHVEEAEKLFHHALPTLNQNAASVSKTNKQDKASAKYKAPKKAKKEMKLAEVKTPPPVEEDTGVQEIVDSDEEDDKDPEKNPYFA